MNLVVWIDNPGGGALDLLNPAAQVLNRLYGNLNVIGFVAPKELNTGDFKKIKKTKLRGFQYDFVLVTGQKVDFHSVLKEAESLGLKVEKFLLDRTVVAPNFTFEKYNKLRNSKLSILAMNCTGGLLYHRFGLPFLSPTINMFTSEQDFLKFLQNPIEIVQSNLNFVGTKFEQALKFDYPIFEIGGSEWHMNHYRDFEFAKQKWIERSERINWFNTIVTMFTESPEVLAEFDKLPFSKKICFVNFESDLDSAYFLDNKKYNEPLWRMSNLTALGAVNFYDMWDMLLYGKKTPLF